MSQPKVMQKMSVAKRLGLKLNDPGSSYCVQGRVETPYGREGIFSEPVCGPSGGSYGRVGSLVYRS